MIHTRINNIKEFIKNEDFNDLWKKKNIFDLQNKNELELFFNSINKNYKFNMKFIPMIENELNSEIKIMHLMKKLVIKMKTPHIVLPIDSRNFKIDDIIKFYPEHEQILKKYQQENNCKNLNILICEGSNHGNLLELLKKRYNNCFFTLMHWKVLFFQILSVLAIIQDDYPLFKHNYLNIQNILIEKISDPHEFFNYKVAGKKYFVNNNGYQIKLTNFGLSCIPGLIENDEYSLSLLAKVLAENTGNSEYSKNKCYDLYYFIDNLLKEIPDIMTNVVVPQKIKNFINRIQFGKILYGKNGNMIGNKKYESPKQILEEDALFTEFKK